MGKVANASVEKSPRALERAIDRRACGIAILYLYEGRRPVWPQPDRTQYVAILTDAEARFRTCGERSRSYHLPDVCNLIFAPRLKRPFTAFWPRHCRNSGKTRYPAIESRSCYRL